MTVLFIAPSGTKKTLIYADKCFTMKTGKGKKLINKIYTLHEHPLQTNDLAKYLGITLTSDLKYNTHISNTTRKANSILGLLRKNLKLASQTLITRTYHSLVRPHLECAATVWSPHTAENISTLEMVQRRAARYTCNRLHNTSSVKEIIGHLGWDHLAARQNNMRLQMMYRISCTPAGDAWQRWLAMSTRQDTWVAHVEVYSSQPIN